MRKTVFKAKIHLNALRRAVSEYRAALRQDTTVHHTSKKPKGKKHQYGDLWINSKELTTYIWNGRKWVRARA